MPTFETLEWLSWPYLEWLPVTTGTELWRCAVKSEDGFTLVQIPSLGRTSRRLSVGRCLYNQLLCQPHNSAHLFRHLRPFGSVHTGQCCCRGVDAASTRIQSNYAWWCSFGWGNWTRTAQRKHASAETKGITAGWFTYSEGRCFQYPDISLADASVIQPCTMFQFWGRIMISHTSFRHTCQAMKIINPFFSGCGGNRKILRWNLWTRWPLQSFEAIHHHSPTFISWHWFFRAVPFTIMFWEGGNGTFTKTAQSVVLPL